MEKKAYEKPRIVELTHWEAVRKLAWRFLFVRFSISEERRVR